MHYFLFKFWKSLFFALWKLRKSWLKASEFNHWFNSDFARRCLRFFYWKKTFWPASKKQAYHLASFWKTQNFTNAVICFSKLKLVISSKMSQVQATSKNCQKKTCTWIEKKVLKTLKADFYIFLPSVQLRKRTSVSQPFHKSTPQVKVWNIHFCWSSMD